jgi:hypothetical protein
MNNVKELKTMANKDTLSSRLLEDAGWIDDYLKGRYPDEVDMTPEFLEDCKEDLLRAYKILNVLEIRKQSLNNIRNEVNRYMDELNGLLD